MVNDYEFDFDNSDTSRDSAQNNENGDPDGGEKSFWTEKGTRLLYEARFFGDFVIVRPASPFFYEAINRMSNEEFADGFEEFLGDNRKVRKYIDDAKTALSFE